MWQRRVMWQPMGNDMADSVRPAPQSHHTTLPDPRPAIGSPRPRPLARVALAALATVLVLPCAIAHAQTPQQKPAQPTAAAAKTATPSRQSIKLPHVNAMTLMIQSHMSALAQAITTNNFTVLRDLASPQFQELNPPAKLQKIFGGFRRPDLDFSHVILFVPIVHGQPAVSDNGQLQLAGHYPTHPLQVHFDMTFLPVAERWRMHTISVRLAPAPKPEAAAKPEAAGNEAPVERTLVSNVNMRDAPSLSGKVLDTLQPGSKVVLVGPAAENAEWHKVKVGEGPVGFIKSDVLMANSR